jgi:hypothetical protein
MNDQDQTLLMPCPFSCTFQHLNINLCRGVMWEPSMGTSHRLSKPVSKQQLDKQNYPVVTNNRNNTGIVARGFYTWVRLKASTELYEEYTADQSARCLGPVSTYISSSAVRVFAWHILEVAMWPVKGAGWRRVSTPNQPDQLTHQASLNQPDQLTLWLQVGTSRTNSLSGFICLHWTACPIKRASVNSSTPSSLTKQQRRQPTSTTSHMAIAISRRPVTSRDMYSVLNCHSVVKHTKFYLK